MFKSKVASLAIFTALTTASSIASASLITFDDIKIVENTSYTVVPYGYKGFDWDNVAVTNRDYYPSSGYEHGVVSGKNVAANLDHAPSSFSSNVAFTLNDLYITKAWYAGITRLEGYVGSTLTFSKDIYSSTTAPTFVTLNWTGLSRVTFSDGNGTEHSAFDNIRVNEPIPPVPEPETYALMGMGLMALIVARRSKLK